MSCLPQSHCLHWAWQLRVIKYPRQNDVPTVTSQMAVPSPFNLIPVMSVVRFRWGTSPLSVKYCTSISNSSSLQRHSEKPYYWDRCDESQHPVMEHTIHHTSLDKYAFLKMCGCTEFWSILIKSVVTAVCLCRAECCAPLPGVVKSDLISLSQLVQDQRLTFSCLTVSESHSFLHPLFSSLLRFILKHIPFRLYMGITGDCL